MEKQCILCGETFTASDRAKKQELCPSCRRRILKERNDYEMEWNQGGSPRPDFCVVCGKQINTPRTRKYTCSTNCKRIMRNIIEGDTKRQKRADNRKKTAALKAAEKFQDLHKETPPQKRSREEGESSGRMYCSSKEGWHELWTIHGYQIQPGDLVHEFI